MKFTDIEYQNSIIKEINENINNLIPENSRKRKLKKMYDEVQVLKKQVRDVPSKSLGFSYVEIDFVGEYELKLPEYGIEEFDRKLKGGMYFKVVGGTKTYMDLRTSSMPTEFIIRLHYTTLKEFKKQSGKGLLIYRRGREKSYGPDQTISYSIRKKK